MEKDQGLSKALRHTILSDEPRPSGPIISPSGSGEWRRFRLQASRTRYGREDARLAAPAQLLSLFLGATRPRRLLYVTKGAFFRFLSSLARLPDDVAICHQGGIPSRQYCETLKHYSEQLELPLLFVGDLDPLDLTIFASLVRGDPELRQSPSTAPTIHYLGIADPWLGLCKRYLPAQRGGWEAISIKMGATELQHFEVVKQVFPRLDQLIGVECFGLLESGRKLELEGAANLSTYGKGFAKQLVKLLLGRESPRPPLRGHGRR